MTAVDPDRIRALGRERGFHRVHFCDAREVPGVAAYDRFLAEGRHGTMDWLVRGRDARAEPSRLLPGVRSVIVLGVDHGWPRPADPGGLTGKVASYAWGRDYHNLVSKRLQKLCRDLRALGIGAYGGVDSRPLLERAWAERAGLGFVGKNGMVIVPGQTSFLFLAVVLVDVELPPDIPRGDHCGSCVRCLPACPTDAFTSEREIDARRCISYLTIEHRGPIDPSLRQGIGRWVFGCDVCQEVCPHNARDPSCREPDLAPRPDHAWLDLEWVLRADDDAVLDRFTGTPLRRPGAIGLKRNAAIVLGNLADPAARPSLLQGAEHTADVVSEACTWALDRL